MPPPTQTVEPTPTAAPTAVATVTAAPSPTPPVPSNTPTAAPTATQGPPTASPTPLWQPGPEEAETRLRPYASGLAGALVERIFYSRSLRREMPYNIYLPPGYNESSRRYPVLYMLHGGGGHRDEWLGYRLIEVADREFHAGNLQPLIIVTPQGNGGYWINNAGGGLPWGDYVWKDVVQHLDAAYRTLPAPTARAVGGLSMGAYGALNAAFLHPDVFLVVGSHSVSLRSDDGSLLLLGTGEEYRQKDPISLAKTAPGLDRLSIWIDIGQDDMWLPRNTELHDALAARNIPHTWQVKAGDHDYTYWMARTLDYLRFYAGSLVGQ